MGWKPDPPTAPQSKPAPEGLQQEPGRSVLQEGSLSRRCRGSGGAIGGGLRWPA